jgi:hypothetical protein
MKKNSSNINALFYCGDYYSLLLGHTYANELMSQYDVVSDLIWQPQPEFPDLPITVSNAFENIYYFPRPTQKFHNAIYNMKERVLLQARVFKDNIELSGYSYLFITKDSGMKLEWLINSVDASETILIEEGIGLYNKKYGYNKKTDRILCNFPDALELDGERKNKCVDKISLRKLFHRKNIDKFLNKLNIEFDTSKITNADLLYIAQLETGLEKGIINKLANETNVEVLVKPHYRDQPESFEQLSDKHRNVSLLNGIESSMAIEILYGLSSHPLVITPASSAGVYLNAIYDANVVFLTDIVYEDSEFKNILNKIKTSDEALEWRQIKNIGGLIKYVSGVSNSKNIGFIKKTPEVGSEFHYGEIAGIIE